MIQHQHMSILNYLRGNSRLSTGDLAGATGLTHAQVNESLQYLHKEIITKHATLIDYDMLNNPLRIHYVFSSCKDRENVLMNSPFVNTIRKDRDNKLLVETVFPTMVKMEEFEEQMEAEKIKTFQKNHIINSEKEEGFLAEPRIVFP